ncbi:hypothetical protein [Paratractidigestivibacter faecalis]|uniref:hypothetical protein n=1 Tax=Paratractidigestivibacter faecalis TaxID=2292441 RepID=UPI003A8FD757
MPDLGDIPVLARGAIPGAAGRVSGGAPDGADPWPAPGLVWLEDGLEVPFRDAGASRPWLEDSSDAPDAPVEHLRPRDHHEEDEPPTLLWV